MGEAQDNGGPDPKRSRPAFDPVAGMRAVADIQAEGLRAAGDLLERILRSEPEAPGTRPPSSTGGVGAAGRGVDGSAAADARPRWPRPASPAR